jgi:ABC-type branched-subunit amino acid transport system ATPase component
MRQRKDWPPKIRTEIWSCLEALKADGLSILLIDKNIAALRRLATAHIFIEMGVTAWWRRLVAVLTIRRLMSACL